MRHTVPGPAASSCMAVLYRERTEPDGASHAAQRTGAVARRKLICMAAATSAAVHVEVLCTLSKAAGAPEDERPETQSSTQRDGTQSNVGMGIAAAVQVVF
jgi:hypothetical protein